MLCLALNKTKNQENKMSEPMPIIKRGPSKLDQLKAELNKAETELEYFRHSNLSEAQLSLYKARVKRLKEQIEAEKGKQFQNGQINIDEKLKQLSAQKQNPSPAQMAQFAMNNQYN